MKQTSKYTSHFKEEKNPTSEIFNHNAVFFLSNLWTHPQHKLIHVFRFLEIGILNRTDRRTQRLSTKQKYTTQRQPTSAKLVADGSQCSPKKQEIWSQWGYCWSPMQKTWSKAFVLFWSPVWMMEAVVHGTHLERGGLPGTQKGAFGTNGGLSLWGGGLNQYYAWGCLPDLISIHRDLIWLLFLKEMWSRSVLMEGFQ